MCSSDLNYIKTEREPKIFYKKGIGVLSEIILGNIEKERSKLKELDKGNKQGSGAVINSTTAI